MADDEKRFSGERSKLLLKLMAQNQKQKERQPGEAEPSMPGTSRGQIFSSLISQSKQRPGTSTASMGRGRATLLNLLKLSQPTSAARSEEVGAHSHGRGLQEGLIKKITSCGQPLLSEDRPIPKVPTPVKVCPPVTDTAGVLGKLSDLSMYCKESSSGTQQKPKEMSRQGTTGEQVQITANYINLRLDPGKGLFQYEVKYFPEIDSRPLRKKLLNEHAVALGVTKVFDGVLLYLPKMLEQEKTTFYSDHPMDGSKITLTVIFKGEQKLSKNVNFFNVLINRVQRALNLVRIGRQNFNPKCAHSVPQHRLEVWPGYVTAIHEHEGGLMLCVDARHRVLRTDTVHDLMRDLYHKRRNNFKESVLSEVIGCSVLTRYNNKTYRIDDVAWDKNPTFTFETQDGTKTTLIDYYKQHWNIVIQDEKQPLLVHRGKGRLPTGETEEKIILLVPELCYVAGLTDSIRSDFRVMKDLDAITKIGPDNRADVIKRFIQEMEKNEVAREILTEWGLKFDSDTARLSARVLPPETILFGDNRKFTVAPGGDYNWNSASVRNPVIRTPNLREWIVLFCDRDSRCSTDFIAMMRKVSRGMGMEISQPRTIVLRDDRTETYVRELRNNICRSLELISIIFPTNRSDRYAAVKKICCVEMPIPSQVIIAKTISRADRLQSVTQKIALQINCKLGGALWALKIPMNNCMICGIDVYHGGEHKGIRSSVAGFVASLDVLLTTWHSKVSIQGHQQELVNSLQILFLSAIRAYHKHNGCNPDRILIYRDGVGEGEFETVANYEVKQLLAVLNNISPNYKPQLSVIIVHKRINTRIFGYRPSGLQNPSSGTIVDSIITKQSYYDFYLVSQHARQGTVAPTYYIVVYDTSSMQPDHMQRITYKLCHLYYNWSGTVKVPAPCRYAHKLVYLVGESIRAQPHEALSHKLYYL